ncbi:MAG: hypothetical protein ACI4NE_08160 [Succinivibrio sp.]
MPLVIVICEGEDANRSVHSRNESNVIASACDDGDIDSCLKARDRALVNENYEKAFSYMKTLCERYKDADSCFKTYETFFAMQRRIDQKNTVASVTLYEVLYYLDIGCQLNNYDSCLRAARIYEYGVKPGHSQALYGYNIAYDAQEAKRYYKKVCQSVSESAYEACSKVVELSNKSRNITYTNKKSADR